MIVLHYTWGLGDTVLVTGLARDVAAANPHREVVADVSFKSLLAHHPTCRAATKEELTRSDALHVRLDLIPQQNWVWKRGGVAHALEGLRRCFRQFSGGLPCPPGKPSGQIVLSDFEQTQPLVAGRYWLAVAGGKLDRTVKVWSLSYWQQVTDRLAGLGIRLVQAGARHARHVHPPLRNVLNMVGKAEAPRDFVNLVAHAEGIICGVTGAMHLAACFDKPCVVLGGAFETPCWEHYTNDYPGSFGEGSPSVAVPHRYLHTVGRLPCSTDRGVGCWRRRTVPIEKADLGEAADGICTSPERLPGQIIPACMALIKPDDVVDAVLAYYREGTIAAMPDPHDPLPVQARPGELPEKEAGTRHLVPPPPVEPPPATVSGPLDHPFVGGKLTVCVLCYGDYAHLARRCLGSILGSAYADRLRLRVLAQSCCGATVDYLRSLGPRLERLYVWDQNRGKAAAVRQLWHDVEAPLETEYVAWFDDDSFVVNDDWAGALAREIAANHPQGARLYGIRFVHDLLMYRKNGHRPEDWFAAASWYRGRPWSTRTGQKAANGSVIPFVAGGFLGIARHVIVDADICDRRLHHNGIDVCIGAQVYQAGYAVKQFNDKKRLVHSSGAQRRGLAEAFPWSPAGSAFQRAELP